MSIENKKLKTIFTRSCLQYGRSYVHKDCRAKNKSEASFLGIVISHYGVLKESPKIRDLVGGIKGCQMSLVLAYIIMSRDAMITIIFEGESVIIIRLAPVESDIIYNRVQECSVQDV